MLAFFTVSVYCTRRPSFWQEATRSRQIAERLGVEEAHMLEFQQFNMVWDKRMEDYERHAEDMVFAMRVSGATVC